MTDPGSNTMPSPRVERAIAAARAYKRGITTGQRELARAYDCSHDLLSRAVVVHRAQPGLLDDVLAGRLTLDAAWRRVQRRRVTPDPSTAREVITMPELDETEKAADEATEATEAAADTEDEDGDDD